MVDSIYYRPNINETYKMKQNIQNGISELYAHDKISKYSGNPNDILKSAKKINEKLYTKETKIQNCHCWTF